MRKNMSVIAVKIYERFYEIASDSIIVRGYTKTGDNVKSTKLFEENEVVVGSSGTARDIGLFRLFLKTHKPSSATEEGILDLFSEFSDWKKKKTDSYGTENVFIIGYKDKVFKFNDFYIDEVVSYEAIGAGMDYALGVLHYGGNVEDAVNAAIKLSIYCDSPAIIIRKEK